MSQPAASFLLDYEAWLRERSLGELAPLAEVRALRDELRADDAFWEEQRPRFDRAWELAEKRLREEQRSLRELLGPRASERVLEAIEAMDPDPEAVKAFLHSPAVEAMLGNILYAGIFEFIKRVDLIGNLVNRLPVIGGIRRKLMSAFKEEIDQRLEGQIKGFLGGFSGLAVERMIRFVLSEENQPGFRKARRKAAEHLLDRPLSSLLPAPDGVARLRDRAWEVLREPGIAHEDRLLERFYARWGDERLSAWTSPLHPRARDLLARPLASFLDASPWTLARSQE